MSNKFLEKTYVSALNKSGYLVEDVFFNTSYFSNTTIFILKIKLYGIYAYHKVIIDPEIDSSLFVQHVANSICKFQEELDIELNSNDICSSFAAKQITYKYYLDKRDSSYIYDSLLLFIPNLEDDYSNFREFFLNLDEINPSGLTWRPS